VSGVKDEAHGLLDVVHRLCLEREPVVRMPPDTPLYVYELFATLGATIEPDPSMKLFRLHPL
jgi:hypothetical protein